MSQCRKLQYTKIKWILETPYDIQDEAKMACLKDILPTLLQIIKNSR